MRRGGPAWRTLGIAPTPELRDIRRAYAAKLKAIDVEQDSKGFIALREAFEQAQREAEWMRMDVADQDHELLNDGDGPEETGTAAPIASLARPAPPDAEADAAQRSPWAPPTPGQIDAHASALMNLLHRNDLEPRPWPSDAEKSEMLKHWRVIQADPRLQQLDFHSDVEAWIARLVGYTIPFSDMLIVPVTEFFGWMRDEGTVTQSAGMAEITERYRMLRFIEEIQRPQSQYHAAWCELTTPADDNSVRGKIAIKKVHRLLHIVRISYPGIEGNFDPYRVALWDRRGTPIGAEPATAELDLEPERKGYARWGFALFILVACLLRVAFSESSTPAPAAPAPIFAVLDRQDADIQQVLKRIGDGKLDWAEVGRRNPKLAQLLRSNWDIARGDGKNFYDFAANMQTLLNERAFAQMRTASDAILSEYRTLVLEQARFLRNESPMICSGFFRGENIPERRFPDSIDRRRAALISKTLIEATAEPVERSAGGTFAIPNTVFDAAARSAGLSKERLQKGLLNRGSDADNCNGRIALMETVLNMPSGPARSKLLRSL